MSKAPTIGTPESLIAYRAEYVLPITSSAITNGAVALRGDRIVAVGPADKVITAPYAVVDLGRAVILPGFVNVHSHLELTLLRGYLEERKFHRWIEKLVSTFRKLTQTDLQISALYGAVEAARHGVTTLADTGQSGATVYGLYESGLRGIFFQEVFGPDPQHLEQSFETLQSKVGELRARSTKLIEIGVSPHAPYSVSAKLYSVVANYAMSEGLKVALHAAESIDEAALVRTATGNFAKSLQSRGIVPEAKNTSVLKYLESTGILHCSPLLIHMVQVDDEDIALAGRYGCSVAHCPKSNAKFGHGRAPIERMLKAGLRVALGSDSVASNNSMDMLEEARFAYMLHACALRDSSWIDAATLLELITIRSAEALGLASEIGSLEVGKQADMIAIELDLVPIYDIEAAVLFAATTRRVKLTVVAGREVYRHGAMTTVDEHSLEQEILRIAKKI